MNTLCGLLGKAKYDTLSNDKITEICNVTKVDTLLTERSIRWGRIV